MTKQVVWSSLFRKKQTKCTCPLSVTAQQGLQSGWMTRECHAFLPDRAQRQTQTPLGAAKQLQMIVKTQTLGGYYELR